LNWIFNYTRSILKGLRRIHDKGFVHCDMKLDNMLLFENGEVKIADFGLAKKAGEKQGELKLEGLLFILHLNQSTTMNTSRGLILGLLAVLLLRWWPGSLRGIVSQEPLGNKFISYLAGCLQFLNCFYRRWHKSLHITDTMFSPS